MNNWCENKQLSNLRGRAKKDRKFHQDWTLANGPSKKTNNGVKKITPPHFSVRSRLKILLFSIRIFIQSKWRNSHFNRSRLATNWPIYIFLKSWDENNTKQYLTIISLLKMQKNGNRSQQFWNITKFWSKSRKVYIFKNLR